MYPTEETERLCSNQCAQIIYDWAYEKFRMLPSSGRVIQAYFKDESALTPLFKIQGFLKIDDTNLESTLTLREQDIEKIIFESLTLNSDKPIAAVQIDYYMYTDSDQERIVNFNGVNLAYNREVSRSRRADDLFPSAIDDV